MTAPLYPVQLSLEGRRVLLVGGGVVATHKAGPLLASGARLTVVAPSITGSLRERAAQIITRPFAVDDLEGVSFVVAAAPADVNRQVAEAAHARGLFVLAVDQPADGSAQSPAIVRRGGLTITIGTDGAAPALSGLLREALDALLPDDDTTERWIQLASEARVAWKRDAVPHAQRRPLLLTALDALYASRAST